MDSDGGHCVEGTSVLQADNGSLQATGNIENVWAFHEDGRPFEELLVEATFNTSVV
jgi:hypothetical protein